MPIPKPVLVKYVFLDIVGYTRNRSVEAQVHVIEQLNKIVLEAIKEVLEPASRKSPTLASMPTLASAIKEVLEPASRKSAEMATTEPTHKVFKNVILLPTGDGICICIDGDDYPYDCHVRLALQILIAARIYTTQTSDPELRIDLRIGVNQNHDNLVMDINGKLNVAGSGINTAQRLMDAAEPGTIRVGQGVYEMLHQRKDYMNRFQRLDVMVKHDISLTTYLYEIKNLQGLGR